ncbi:fibronectin type III domain-containing protein, partial [Singulisphaera rosea]
MPSRQPSLASSAFACLLGATLAASAFAHDGHEHPPEKVADVAVHKPTPMPDRIILTWTGDPARSQAVTWRTDGSANKASAQIARASAAPKFVEKVETVDATSQDVDTNLNHAHFHSAVFEGLEPSTLYAYRVGDGVNWSEWFHFKTASDKPEPFTFIYFGDAQNDVKSLWSRVIRGAYSDAPKARFIIHAGDLINRANSDAEWGEWHASGGWLNGMVPSVPTPGNHEYERPKAAVDVAVKAAADDS